MNEINRIAIQHVMSRMSKEEALDKVRKLIVHVNQNQNKNEAANAEALARKIMSDYGITEKEAGLPLTNEDREREAGKLHNIAVRTLDLIKELHAFSPVEENPTLQKAHQRLYDALAYFNNALDAYEADGVDFNNVLKKGYHR